MNVDDWIAAVDTWGRVQRVNGYRSQQAHGHPTDMGAGQTSLAMEGDEDTARRTWAEPLVARVNDGAVTEAQLHELVRVVDEWGFVQFLDGWGGRIGVDNDGDDAERKTWIRQARALLA